MSGEKSEWHSTSLALPSPVSRYAVNCWSAGCVFRIFFFQFVVQLHELFPSHGWTRFKYLRMDDPLLNTRNTEHHIRTMDIRLYSWCGFLSKIAPWFFAHGIILMYQFYIPSDYTMQKLSFFAVERAISMYKNAFQWLLILIRITHNFHAFESLPLTSKFS